MDARSIFSRYPRSTLLLTSTLLMLAVALLAEIYLSQRYAFSETETRERYIRLREHAPNRLTWFTPPERYLAFTTTLEARPYRFQVDEDGYIIAESTARLENPQLSILFLGGSTTECQYVDEALRFPHLVEQFMRDQGIGINTYNSGHSGNHTLHSLNILVNKAMDLPPDIAVMMHNINDLNLLLHEGSYWNDHLHRSLLIEKQKPSPYTLLRELKDILFPNLFRLARSVTTPGVADEFAHSRGRALHYDAERMAADFRNNLLMFIGTCRSYGITPVLMTQANQLTATPSRTIADQLEMLASAAGNAPIPYGEYRQMFIQFNEMIREVAAEQEVVLVDLARLVPQSDAFLYDAVHYNDSGSRLVAEIIAARLMKEAPSP